jgi:prepilin-type N-terminal cleavage/methylation domain-containing protein
MSTRYREQGFSLVEILVVVMVIGIIAAISIPNFMRARAAAYHASATSTLRLMVSMQHAFWVQRGRYARLNELSQSQNDTLGPTVGPTLPRQGYIFQMIPTAPSDAQLASEFRIAATELSPDTPTPIRLVTDQSGEITQLSP